MHLDTYYLTIYKIYTQLRAACGNLWMQREGRSNKNDRWKSGRSAYLPFPAAEESAGKFLRNVGRNAETRQQESQVDYAPPNDMYSEGGDAAYQRNHVLR